MRQLEETWNTYEALMRCVKPEELPAVMQALARGWGYTCCNYVDLSRLSPADESMPFYQTSSSTEFHEAYLREAFHLHDPVLFRASSTDLPFSWTDCPEFHERKRRRRGRKTKALEVMDLAHDFGYGQGYVVPLRGEDSQGQPTRSLISFFWSESPEPFMKQDTSSIFFRMVAAFYHERVLALRDSASSEPQQRPMLTNHERDCLKWASEGKTASETAMIRGISGRTVEYHLQNAMSKLGVHSKIHAVAVALRRGLI